VLLTECLSGGTARVITRLAGCVPRCLADRYAPPADASAPKQKRGWFGRKKDQSAAQDSTEGRGSDGEAVGGYDDDEGDG